MWVIFLSLLWLLLPLSVSLLLFLNADEKREGDGGVASGAVLSLQDDAAEGPMVRGKQGPGGGWEGEAQVGGVGKRAPSSLQ